MDHIEELGNARPDEPVVFCKPETALLKNNAAFFYPGFSEDIHYEVEILIRVCKAGKSIGAGFAHRYYDEIGIGVDFTARDLQSKAKAKGLPWDVAKGFNGSAPVSGFLPKSRFDLCNLGFSLKKDGEEVQRGDTSLMLFGFDEIVSYMSRFFTLKKGDIIFTGTPGGVGPVHIGNRLEAFIEGVKMMDFEVR